MGKVKFAAGVQRLSFLGNPLLEALVFVSQRDSQRARNDKPALGSSFDQQSIV
jgi:hypothetical protein